MKLKVKRIKLRVKLIKEKWIKISVKWIKKAQDIQELKIKRNISFDSFCYCLKKWIEIRVKSVKWIEIRVKWIKIRLLLSRFNFLHSFSRLEYTNFQKYICQEFKFKVDIT